MFTEKLKDNQLKAKIEVKLNTLKQMRAGVISKDDPEMKAAIEDLAQNARMYTLPPDRTIKIDEKAEVSSMLVPSSILEHFIRKASHRFIMNWCGCRDSNNCRDYPIELGCIFLGEAAKDIHPELGRLASVDEALEHAQRWREAGLHNNVGHAPHDAAFLEVGPVDRFMTVCGCCLCCCINKEVGLKTRMPGIEIRVMDNCTRCGICIDTCLYNGMAIEDDKAHTTASCIGCGRCADACPDNAIEVTVIDPSYIEKTLQSISEKVDVA